MTTETPTSEAGGRAAFSVALDGMRVLEASTALERLAGRPAGALLDHPVAELWAATERAAIAARFDDVVIYGSDEIGSLALVRPDGSHVLVDLEARYAHRGGERLEIVVVPLEGIPDRFEARTSDIGRPTGGEPDTDEKPRIDENSFIDEQPETDENSITDEKLGIAGNIDDVEIETTVVDSAAHPVVPFVDPEPVAEALGPEEESVAGPETQDPADVAGESGTAATIGVLDAAGLGALAVDADGNATGATALAGRILGRSADNLIGLHVDRLFVFEEATAGVLADARAEGSRQKLRAGARGGSVHAALEWIPVGAFGEGVLLIREMVPEDEITDRLKRRQRLADSAAHDARNALNSMAYGFSTLRERMLDEPKMLEIIDDLDSGRVRVRAIIDERLDSIEGGTGVNELIDLSAMLREVLARFSSEARAGQVELRDDLLPDVAVCTDAGRLRRAFENIAENALRAMPDGGTLSIRTILEDRDRMGVRIEVQDNGIGMEESVRSRVFEQGFSTGAGRRGLGLSSVRDFIVSIGGEIDCMSAPEHGSLFIVWVPRRSG